jgi:hypothetical protein
MNMQTSIRVASNNKYTDEQLGIIRRHMVQIVESGDCDLPVTLLVDQVISLLNHINLATLDNPMVDVLALQEKLTDRETRLRENGKAYFQLSMQAERSDEENKRLKEKIKLLEARVNEITTGAC